MGPLVCATCGRSLATAGEVCEADGGRAVVAGTHPDLLAADPLLGALLDQRYQVVARGRSGGTARVYRAVHIGLEREVALKILHPMEDPGTKGSRFLREARVLAALRHPRIVPVQDFGTWEDRPYLVMPWVAGGSLKDWLTGTEPGLHARLDVTLDLLDALGAAHQAGIVHRDVKPSNALLDLEDGRTVALLGDFGIALAEEEQTRLTAEGSMLGTPAYMAPEQFRRGEGESIGPAADLYGVGCVAFALLAGRPPHRTDSLYELMYAKLHQPPAPLAELSRFPLPGGLVEVIERALAVRPTHRWPDAQAFAKALRGCVAATEATTLTGTLTQLHPVPSLQPDDADLIGRIEGERLPPGRRSLARRLARLAESAIAPSEDGAIVVLAGPAGVGKSHLGRWLTARLEQSWFGQTVALEGHEQSGPLHVVRELLALRCGLGDTEVDSDPSALVRRRLRRLELEDAIPVSAALRLLRPHTVEDTPDVAPRLQPEAIARWILAEARRHPLAALLDSAEKLDRVSCRVLDALAGLLTDRPAPLLVVVGLRTRPNGAVAGPLQALLRLAGRNVHHLNVRPLDAEGTSELCETSWPDAPASVRERLWERSGGIPMFALALLTHWRQQPERALRAEASRIELVDERLPPALAELLLSVVEDSAPPEAPERFLKLLQALAVVADGEVPGALLEHYLEALGWEADERDELLDVAVEVGLIRDVGRGGEEVLALSHDLLRDALLSTLAGRRSARRLHRIAARTWATWGGPDDPEAVTARAAHLVAAGDLEPAAEASVRAARMAELLGSKRRAEELLEAGVRALGQAHGPLRTVRGRLHLARAELAGRYAELARMRELSTAALGDLDLHCDTDSAIRALRLLARGAGRSPELAGPIATLRAAADRLLLAELPQAAAAALFEAGGLLLARGDDVGATTLLRQAAGCLHLPEADDAGAYDLLATLPPLLPR